MTILLVFAFSTGTAAAYNIPGDYYQNDAFGGDCHLVGTWDAATRTCTLNQDVSGSIYISPWNGGVTIDGAGHSLIGDGSPGSVGIFLQGYHADMGGGNTVKNLNIINHGSGISSDSSHNTIINNSISGNRYGIYFSSYLCQGLSCQAATFNTVSNNNFLDNTRQVEDYTVHCIYTDCGGPVYENRNNNYDGNYWRGWGQYGTGGSLLPYVIATGQVDNHPLSNMVNVPLPIDNLAPVVDSITADVDSIRVAYHDADSYSGIATAAVTIDGSAVAGCAFGSGNLSCPTPSGLADGSHVIAVLLTDPAGNAGSGSVSVTVPDSFAPALSNLQPTGTVTVSATTVTADFSDLSGTSGISSGIDPASARIRLNGGAWAACAASGSPAGTVSCDVSGLMNGFNQLEMSIADVAGNVGYATLSIESDLGIIHLRDDATGGDCIGFGTWSSLTKTCRLSRNLHLRTIAIDSDGITLDGGGFTMNGYQLEPYSVTYTAVDINGRGSVTVKNMAINQYVTPINLAAATGNTITSNQIYETGYAPTPDGYMSYYGGTAITLQNSDSNLIAGNTVDGTGIIDPGIAPGSGISLYYSNSNSISGNTISGSVEGVSTYDAFNNSFYGNTISQNETGISFAGASADNRVYHNNFINNQTQASSYGANLFNLQLPDGGNFWSNWIGPDANGDGFVDAPYAVAVAGSDSYPWTAMNAWGCEDPKLSISRPRPYWANLADYQMRRLSVDYTITNSGAATATGVSIVGTVDSAGATSLSPLPGLGNILPGASANTTIPYNVPTGVNAFRTTVFTTASNSCGTVLSYPGPWPGA